MEKAGPAGAMGVESALSAPPAAFWMGVPPAAPEPMNDPTTAITALTATVICRARSERVAVDVDDMGRPSISQPAY